ncbi:hypothetical protein KIPB_013032, partial [Kipferlia bialata]|eukprot:g13032.t1
MNVSARTKLRKSVKELDPLFLDKPILLDLPGAKVSYDGEWHVQNTDVAEALRGENEALIRRVTALEQENKALQEKLGRAVDIATVARLDLA